MKTTSASGALSSAASAPPGRGADRFVMRSRLLGLRDVTAAQQPLDAPLAAARW